MNFKIGDKVRRTNNDWEFSGGIVRRGEVYTIREFEMRAGVLAVALKEFRLQTGDGPWFSGAKFELVPRPKRMCILKRR